MKEYKTSWFKRRLPYIFIFPTLALLLFLAFFPLIWSLGLSFYKYSVMNVYGEPIRFIGLQNYIKALSDTYVWSRWVTTAEFVVAAVSLEFIVGFTLAYLLSENFKGRRVILTLLLIPMMLAPAAVGFFWRFMLDESFGIFNYFTYALFGVRIPWFTSFEYAMLSIIIVDVWQWSPFMMLVILSGMLAVPKHLYEASRIDRASGWMKFRYITLPTIKPILAIALLFRTVDAFKLFDIAFIMTSGGPGTTTEVFSLHLFRTVFLYFLTGEGCALSYIFMVVIIILVNIYLRYFVLRPEEV